MNTICVKADNVLILRINLNSYSHTLKPNSHASVWVYISICNIRICVKAFINVAIVHVVVIVAAAVIFVLVSAVAVATVIAITLLLCTQWTSFRLTY